jgi:magnesium transporter
MDGRWTDLLDPDENAVLEHAPASLESADLWQAFRPAGDARPRVVARDEYVFAVLLIGVAVKPENRVYYQEIDVVLTPERLLTIRKTPPDGEPFDVSDTRDACAADDPVGTIVTRLLDTVAERYLALVDDIDDEVEELEDLVEHGEPVEVGRRIAQLRRDMLRVRRTLAPTRDAVRRAVDGRVESRVGDVFTHEAELVLADVYDKLLRATEGLDLARDLVAGARDYHQAQIATAQNEIVKLLAVTASLLLVPTFIVGVYGQNFDHMPELHWRLGYVYSWAVIVLATLAQLVFFRWKRWI